LAGERNSERGSKGRDAQKGFLYQDVFCVYLLLDMLDPEKRLSIKEIVVEGIRKRIEDIRVVFDDGTVEYYQVKTKDPPRNWSKPEITDIIQKFLAEKPADNEKFVFISDNNPDAHCIQLCDTIEKVRNSQDLSEKDKKIVQEIGSSLGMTYQEIVEALHKIRVDIGKGKFESLYENTCHKAGMILGIKNEKEVDKLIRSILAEVFMKSSAEAPWKRRFNRNDIKKIADSFCQQHETQTASEERNRLFGAPSRPPYNLVGREDLLHNLKQQLLDGDDLALYGLPGVGKTALIRELAYDDQVLHHFCDGILWAGIGQEGDVLSHLGKWGALLGISQYDMARLTNIEDKAKAIQAAIGMQKMLLVIDDIWETKKGLDFKLGGPNCVHLITTRIPEVALLFAGEKATKVDELSEDDGLELLAQLAPGVVEAELDEAQELVRAVGGLPLAIVLIGNYLRIKTHSGQPRRLRATLKELSEARKRLEIEQPQGVLEHHPSLPSDVPLSLKAAINISEKALDEAPRRTFRSLSVFPPKPNSFSEEAALAVCGEPIETLDVLIDFGLLESAGPDRYTLHQVIADYARVKLIDKTAYNRMAEFSVEFLEIHKTDYSALDIEITNVLVALQAAFDQEMHEALVRGANAFYKFLDTRGLYEAAEIHLNRAQQAAEYLKDVTGQVTTLLNLGTIARKCGKLAAAEEYAREGLTIAHRIGWREIISSFLILLGMLAWLRGDYEQAEKYYQEGLTLAREIGHRENICLSLAGLGALALTCGNYKQAEEYSQEGLTLARKIGNYVDISSMLMCLGWVKTNQGNYVRAEECYQESLIITSEIGHREGISKSQVGLGAVAVDRGDYEQAEKRYQESLTIAREIGHRERVSVALMGLGTVALSRGDYEQAEKRYQESLTIAREIGHHDRISILLGFLGYLALSCGNYKQAEEYLQEGLTLAREIGYVEGIIDILSSLGYLALSCGNYKQAEEYLQEGLTLAREIGYRWYVSFILSNWGEFYLKQQKLELASVAFMDALKIAQEIGGQELTAIALFGLARVAAAQGNIVEAYDQGQESQRIFETMGHKDTAKIKKWLKELPSISF